MAFLEDIDIQVSPYRWADKHLRGIGYSRGDIRRVIGETKKSARCQGKDWIEVLKGEVHFLIDES